MEAARSEPERAERAEPEVVVHVAQPTAGDRARRALRCPYCHDDATRGSLVCARPGCGATYHVACWDECRGGCVALGCGSREARAVGRLRLLTRFARLLLAAWLFPPRLVAAVREGTDARPELQARARELARSLWTGTSGLPLLLHLLWSVVQIVAGLFALPLGVLGGWLGGWAAFRLGVDWLAIFTVIGGFFGGLAAGLALLRRATWPGVWVLLLGRAVLRGELDLLDRPADPKAKR